MSDGQQKPGKEGQARKEDGVFTRQAAHGFRDRQPDLGTWQPHCASSTSPSLSGPPRKPPESSSKSPPRSTKTKVTSPQLSEAQAFLITLDR